MARKEIERSNVFLGVQDKQKIKEIAEFQGIHYSKAVRNALKLYIQCHEYLLENNIYLHYYIYKRDFHLQNVAINIIKRLSQNGTSLFK